MQYVPGTNKPVVVAMIEHAKELGATSGVLAEINFALQMQLRVAPGDYDLPEDTLDKLRDIIINARKRVGYPQPESPPYWDTKV